ncbi:MAG: hypothetical protein RLO50_22290 [Azospirillaceae bacterium]
MDRMGKDMLDAYGPCVQAVWRAVTDETAPMKLPAGADAQTWFREEGLSAA